MAYILHIEVAVNNFESYALSRNEKTFIFSLGCEYEILAGKMFVSSRREYRARRYQGMQQKLNYEKFWCDEFCPRMTWFHLSHVEIYFNFFNFFQD